MRRACFVLMCLLSILVAAYAIGMYGFGPGAGRLPPEFHESFSSRPLGLAAHILASSTALLLGPLQFSSRTRARWPALHRILGRVYLGLAVPIGGLAGLYLSGFAFGGIVAKLGFSCLAIVWLYTALQGYVTARARDFATHRRWMIRNYSLTFAAVTLRLYMAPTWFLDVPFEVAYQAVAWLCWIPNLVVAECLDRAFPFPSPASLVNRTRPTTVQVETVVAEDLRQPTP